MYYQSKKEYKLEQEHVYHERQIEYLNSLLTNSKFGKEVRLLNYSKYVLDKWYLLKSIIIEKYLGIKGKNYTANLILSIAGFSLIGFFFISVAVSISLGTSTIGSFAGLVSFIAQLGPMLSNVGTNFKNFANHRLKVNDLINFIKETEKPMKENVVNFNEIEPRIIFKNVSFQIGEGMEREILTNINLEINYGESVAIVGENGAGKTSLVNLLLGLYQPTKGSIFLNENNYNKLDINEISNYMGVIFQQPVQYEMSVIDNILLGRKLDTDRLNIVLDKTGVRKIFKNENISEIILGKNFGKLDLSGGEWQKVALARCFYSSKPIYVLDEPTSSLDPISEYEIFDIFREFTKGKTSILISHRLGSVIKADKIIVLKNGEIVETGKHEELIKQNGEYKRLYNLQASWYKEGSVG
ncbi:Vitamin B12 import ATP-binding protein BtuD [Sutcliffiella rhizosphaerae]|uniref:Vitamin B12 import ATP-binding protein BtuD n=2 Tax=Sutcliffiella rhizosphaerae TaxID=2880967 RepID=A0ABM8YUN0_9BACI|nr:Vitamin B12 import ATP-binding protein BtuD [Sutcliffiella rhizosphaerae]